MKFIVKKSTNQTMAHKLAIRNWCQWWVAAAARARRAPTSTSTG